MNFSSIEINENLALISKTIREGYRDEEDIGILTGISGMALFQFHYAQYINNDIIAEQGAEMISVCIDKINSGYSLASYSTGIAGLLWALQHLSDLGFIDIDESEFLGLFDEFLFENMKFQIKNHNYDILHGAIGNGIYFLKRINGTTHAQSKDIYYEYLSELLQALEQNAIFENNLIKWQCLLDRTNQIKGVNFGFSHGLAGIISFLTRLHRIECFKSRAAKLMLGCSEFILRYRAKNQSKISSQFPDTVLNNKFISYNSRLAWCYGDLGIGLSLFQVGNALENQELINAADEILILSTNRQAIDETQVVDAGICHGSFGNSIIYKRVAENSTLEHYLTASKYWFADGMKKSSHYYGYDSYEMWYGKKKNTLPPLQLLDGIAGIGMALLEQVSLKDTKWDECFMIPIIN